MAKLYKVDGRVVEVLPANGTHFELEELQKLVGGYIERLECPKLINDGTGAKRVTMIVDEEGKLKDKSHNANASAVFWFNYPHLKNRDYICGDAVLVEEFPAAQPEDGMEWR